MLALQAMNVSLPSMTSLPPQPSSLYKPDAPSCTFLSSPSPAPRKTGMVSPLPEAIHAQAQLLPPPSILPSSNRDQYGYVPAFCFILMRARRPVEGRGVDELRFEVGPEGRREGRKGEGEVRLRRRGEGEGTRRNAEFEGEKGEGRDKFVSKRIECRNRMDLKVLAKV